MSSNLDDRLLRHWEQSQHRQQVMRQRLDRSSLPLDRFEAWALELIEEALSDPYPEEERALALVVPASGLQADDR